MNITDIIKPITLLSGSHADTGTTGQGCFMNIVSYLNGDAQITDNPPCVCYVMTPLFIFADDFMNKEDRQLMVPFIERAMESRTDDRVEVSRRLKLVVGFAQQQAEYAAQYALVAKSAEYVAKFAKEAARYANHAAQHAKAAAQYAKAAAKNAELVAECTQYAAACAKHAAKSAECAEYRQKTTTDLLALFDEALPAAFATTDITVQRAENLVRLAESV